MTVLASVQDWIGPGDPQPILYIALATVLGAIIGWQRELHGRAAGLRTHMMLCAGCALVMLTSLYVPTLFREYATADNTLRADPTRLAASVLTGLGFLGAGVIIVLGRRVVGLTTATGVWVTAAIGLAVGAGYILPAVFCHMVVVFAMWLVKNWERRAGVKDRDVLLHVTFGAPGAHVAALRKMLEGHDFDLREYTLDVADGKARYKLLVSYVSTADLEKVTLDLSTGLDPQPMAVEWEPS